MKCPQCGRKMKGDWPDKEVYFNCEFCGDRFVIEDDGELVNVFNRGSNNHGTCINCGQSLARGTYTAPWEDGYDSEGFVTSINPLSVISNTPISLVEPSRFLEARITRKED